MDLAQTNIALAASRNFLKENEKFRDWAKELCRLKLFDKDLLPNFDTIPPTFIALLDEHAQALIAEGGGAEVKSGKKPSGKKKAATKAAPVAAATSGKGSGTPTATVSSPPASSHERKTPAAVSQPAVASPTPATGGFAVGHWDEPAGTPTHPVTTSRPQPEFNIFDPFAPAPQKAVAQDAFFAPVVTSPPRATGAPSPATTASPRVVAPGDPFAALTGTILPFVSFISSLRAY
jgi:hypothetical protein